MWTVKVEPVSVGLEETAYAHMVVNGWRTITVAHTRHRNYERIKEKKLGNGYVRYTGVGRRKHDLTPHPEAVVVADALNAIQN